MFQPATNIFGGTNEFTPGRERRYGGFKAARHCRVKCCSAQIKPCSIMSFTHYLARGEVMTGSLGSQPYVIGRPFEYCRKSSAIAQLNGVLDGITQQRSRGAIEGNSRVAGTVLPDEAEVSGSHSDSVGKGGGIVEPVCFLFTNSDHV